MYRQNAKIPALSSGELNKYEYLTGQDLGYRPNPVEKAKFEYSPLGQVFNKGLDSNENQEGLLKRLKNIEGKTYNQLDSIRDQGDRELDLINKVNLGRIKSTEFQNEKLKKLDKEIKNKEKFIKKAGKSKDKEEKNNLFFFIQQQITHLLILMVVQN